MPAPNARAHSQGMDGWIYCAELRASTNHPNRTEKRSTKQRPIAEYAVKSIPPLGGGCDSVCIHCLAAGDETILAKKFDSFAPAVFSFGPFVTSWFSQSRSLPPVSPPFPHATWCRPPLVSWLYLAGAGPRPIFTAALAVACRWSRSKAVGKALIQLADIDIILPHEMANRQEPPLVYISQSSPVTFSGSLWERLRSVKVDRVCLVPVPPCCSPISRSKSASSKARNRQESVGVSNQTPFLKDHREKKTLYWFLYLIAIYF